MANKNGIEGFLEKVRPQIEALQAALQSLLQPKSPAKTSPKNRPAEAETEQQSQILLEIGNELLITGEIIKLYGNLSNALGRVVIIDQISAKDNGTVKASAFGIQIDVDARVARQMREAYLQQEQAWAASSS